MPFSRSAPRSLGAYAARRARLSATAGPDEIRDEVLARLLELNAQHAKESRKGGGGQDARDAILDVKVR